MSTARKSVILAACALTAPLAALAHAHLLRSMPAAASVVAVPPRQLQLEFSEAATLTALSIQKSGDPARRKLAPPPGPAQTRIIVELPLLTPGGYVVTWRALSADSHMASGSFGFTLRAP